MQTVKDNKSLAEAIAHMENVRKSDLNLLKHQVDHTLHELNPINIVKDKIKNVFSSPILKNNAVQAAIGLGTGLLTNNLIVGASGGLVRKAIGMAAQAGITKLAVKDPEKIKDSGVSLLQSFLQKIKIK